VTIGVDRLLGRGAKCRPRIAKDILNLKGAHAGAVDVDIDLLKTIRWSGVKT
jgi:hypothetical protein